MQETGQGRETPNNEKNKVTLKKYVINWKYAILNGSERKTTTVYAIDEKSAIQQLIPYHALTDKIISIHLYNIKDEAKMFITALDNTKNIDETQNATVNLVNFIKRITGLD